MARPIRPDEVEKVKLSKIPDDVFVVFNDLIAKEYSDYGKCAVVGQEEVLRALLAKGFSRDNLMASNWLDVELYYKEAGWSVTYNPKENDRSGRASYTFKPKA